MNDKIICPVCSTEITDIDTEYDDMDYASTWIDVYYTCQYCGSEVSAEFSYTGATIESDNTENSDTRNKIYAQQFDELLEETQIPKDDEIAIREAWLNWTDALYKDMEITGYEYENWDYPC